MADEPTDRSTLVDAEQFLRLSESLREGFNRLGEASLTDSQRQRWQKRLLAITNTAKHDLERAQEQYDRFRRDFERETGA